VKLNNFFTDFIKGVMNTSYASYKKEDIKAIVGVGGASSLAFTKILEIARNAVDNRKAKVFDYIDLSLVVAHGAAMYARDTVLRRDLWGYHYDDEFQYVHDEL
jgi:molecular chaperone DnaK (HSP70)